MGTFTVSSGLGLLLCGIIVMAVMGIVGLWILNKMKDNQPLLEEPKVIISSSGIKYKYN